MVLDNAKSNKCPEIILVISVQPSIQRFSFKYNISGVYRVFCVMGITVYFLAYSTFNWTPYTRNLKEFKRKEKKIEKKRDFLLKKI